MSLNGLTNINLELTSRCNKECWMCGRRERDRLYGKQEYGDMDFSLVEKIASQVPEGIVIQFHNNGEGLLYPRFGEAASLFKHCIRGIVTNGKLLVTKSDEIIENLDTLSVSIIEDDFEGGVQYDILREFLKIKGSRKPVVTLRLVGCVDPSMYASLGLLVISRVLHKPKGSIDYQKSPTIPEIGICWDFLTRLAIDRYGNVSVCVRFDPGGQLVLGNIKDNSLDGLWNGSKRTKMKELHCSGRRKEIPYCGDKCDYWGVPVGGY